jgi:membrane protein YqaA with SNARE-associated domain
MNDWITSLLAALALPQFGLSSVFVVSFVSATVLPMGSEAAVLGLLMLNPNLFWEVMAVATLGNTLGGALTWWMGRQAGMALAARRGTKPQEVRGLAWLRRFGPKGCLLSWLPLVGDPLCGIAGWLKLPFWPCVGYMAVGKFLRYWSMTLIGLKVAPMLITTAGAL